MRVAILTFDGFNEIDSFVPLNILNRVPGLQADLCGPSVTVCSLNRVRVHVEPLSLASEADAVLVGSGRFTRQVVENAELMSSIKLAPERQLIGSQCSGALVLAKLGLLTAQPACTDRSSQPYLEAAGVSVLNKPFHGKGNVATAGGCLASHYLAAWVIWCLKDRESAEHALTYVVPVGEEPAYIDRALSTVEPYISTPGANKRFKRDAPASRERPLT